MQDARRERQVIIFQSIGKWGVPAGDARDGRLETRKASLLDQRGDLRRESARPRRLLDDGAAARLAHAPDHGLDVERPEGAQIDQLCVQLGELAALLLKLFDTIGTWLDAEQVDSLLLHFDERQYTLLRPSKERLHDSNAFLLERVAELETALGSRIAIEQAKGILARALGVNIDQAFSLLRKAARDRGTKLRDLAESIAASPSIAIVI